MDALELLWPRPRAAHHGDGALVWPRRVTLAADGDETIVAPAMSRLRRELLKLGCQAGHSSPDGEAPTVRLRHRPGDRPPESYLLAIRSGSRGHPGVTLAAGDTAGLLYAVATLAQWLRLHADPDGRPRLVPALVVNDSPVFAERGVLLDVSRGKVPRMATLHGLVELLSGLKINQLQLYTEHTFAYRGHEAVWRGASPLRPAEIRRLDAFCRERAVELVPNQQSFGHFHRWLVHPRYRALAECPDGIAHPFSPRREPFSLCPTDPGSLDLLADLYAQLLPCYTSDRLGAGLDEALDLGQCRSAEVCAERGAGAVYLDFVHQVHALAAAHGRRLQMWGDVVLEHPERLGDLPDDVTVLAWGYEADHPWAEQTQRFADAGQPFYVCPGTASWHSFLGRVDVALANLGAAARHGAVAGARGLLITDWGDNGHLQPLPISYPGLVAGAGYAWSPAAAIDEPPLAKLLDAHVFGAEVGGDSMGRLLDTLGRLHAVAGSGPWNGSPLYFQLLRADRPVDERRGARLTADGLADARGALANAVAALPTALRGVRDAPTLGRELSWACRAADLGAELGAARLELGVDRPVGDLPGGLRRRLADGVDELDEGLAEVWLPRYRRGGLGESRDRLTTIRPLLGS